MPKAMEQSLNRAARRKGLKGSALDAYVYGTMRKTGWKPAREKNTGEAIHESEASSIDSGSKISPEKEQDGDIEAIIPDETEDVARPGVSGAGGSYKLPFKKVKVGRKLLNELSWKY